jgi:hypothetical protein
MTTTPWKCFQGVFLYPSYGQKGTSKRQ